MENIIVFFAKNRMLVNIIVIVTILCGIYAYSSIQKESFPSTDLDMVIVQVIYPGASPIDVEKNAAVPIEEELKKITGIEEYTSVIIENAAIILVKLDQTLPDTRPTKDEVFRAMQNVPDLSTDVEEVRVIDANPKMMSVYTIGLHFKEGMEGSEQELYDFSVKLENSLAHLDGVGEIRVEGRTDPEVHIYVDPKKLEQYYISLSDVVKSVQGRNVRATGGDINGYEKDQTVVTIGEFETPKEANDVIIRSSFQGNRARVSDVASEIVEGFVKKNVLMRVNDTTGYSLSVVKKENADILKTIATVKKYIKENQDIVPSNMVITDMQDNSLTIQSLLNVVTSNLISGFLIIFIVLFIFLDMKSAFYTSMGMVVIIFMCLIYMTLTGITFNVISLAAIITVLGMIVDNSIVVSENIFNFKQRGYKGIEATKLGVTDVVMPIIASSMTTITAFLPMLMVSGTMGKFINQFPKVVIAAIIASFFQAIFLLPNQMQDSVKIPKLDKNGNPKKKRFNFKNPLDFNKDIFFDKMKIPFGFALARLLKIRYGVIAGFVALLIGSIFLANDSFKKFVLVYDTSSDTIVINIDSGIGTPIDRTSEYIREIEGIVQNVVKKEELIATYTLVGKQVDQALASEELGSLAGILVYLVPSTERERIADDISALINQEVDKTDLRKKLPVLNIGVKAAMSGTGRAVDIKVVGNNTEQAKKAKEEIRDYLVTIPGVINYDDDDKVGKEELRVKFNYEKAAELGVNVATAANEVRTAYTGTVATYIQGLDNKLDFRVQLDTNSTRYVDTLKNLLIPNNNNRLITLENIASIETTNGVSTLRHYNGERTITLNADIETGKNTSQQVMNNVREHFKGLEKKYPGINIEFGGEAKETVKAIKSLLFSFGIAIAAIYIVLLLQFNRYIQPLLILTIIPFGLIGVLLAFAAHKMPMSFMGFIGIIGLAGVVVNNGIIMVDVINRIIDEGVEDKQGIKDSIVAGAQSRLRPIFLTTATTILGIMPTVYGIGGRADTIVPIVMALAYGLLFASLLTLIFLPCIFMISFDLGLFKIRQKVQPQPISMDDING